MDPQEISPKVKLFASPESWIDGNAITQLKGTSELEGVELVSAFPDLHPGKGGPVGCAIKTKELIYPSFIGNDAGCGIGLWQIDLQRRKLKLDKWAGKLTDLDSPWEHDYKTYLAGYYDISQRDALGTIGGGNHFAELQAVERVENEEILKRCNLDKESLFICVHSGSRGLGQELIKDHAAKHGYGPVKIDDAQEYLDKHDSLKVWGMTNRTLIANRFAISIRADITSEVSNNCHNSVDRKTLIHRKGAAECRGNSLVMIPGSRGALSYLVEPTADQDASLHSIAHGAGRKWARSECRDRLSETYDVESLQQTDLGSRVICEDKDLIYEEAPQAYKNIDMVVRDLVELKLVKVVAVFKPLITYKVRR